VTAAAAAGLVAAASRAGTTGAVTLAVLEALVAAAVAVAWRSRGRASSLLAAGAAAWSVAVLSTVLLPHLGADAPSSLPAWPVLAAVAVLTAGAVAFGAAGRHDDVVAMAIDTVTVMVAATWLLGAVSGGSADWATADTALVLGGALAASVALAVVAHANDLAARLAAMGVVVIAGAQAAITAVRSAVMPDWWSVSSVLGFLIVTAGVVAGTTTSGAARDRARLWAQQLPIAPAAVAVWFAFAHDESARARWTLVAVVVVALARQTVMSARGHARLDQLEQTLGSFRHDAEHDPLTGLANRALFHQRIERALEHPRRRSFAVLFIDLDDFKTINDTLGHAAGDELLVAVAQRLRSTVRAEDTVARLGGDEFGILLNRLEGYEDTQRSAARVLDALQPSFSVGGAAMRVGTSIGLAPFGPRSTTSQLLREADMALYAAKDRGKNQFQAFSWTMQRDARDRFELQAELRQAIEREELVIHYQPIVELPSGRVAGFEALARWKHSTRGVLLPDRFIPLAEELGVIHALGLVILRTACLQLAEWDNEFPDAPPWHIAVNVSVQQFDAPDLLADVTEALADSCVDASRIVLEVTESSMAEDPEHVLHVLQQLRALGVRVAIDDFGTGYSALQYLRRFPLDVLKIDKAFVADVEVGTPGATGETLLRAMLELGHSLGLGTVVEGVESQAQLDIVRRLGCDYVQGYLLGTPGAAAEITGMLRGAATRDWALVRGAADPAPVRR
jgi:diguanylate cyclase (GGDEF)-like protein